MAAKYKHTAAATTFAKTIKRLIKLMNSLSLDSSYNYVPNQRAFVSKVLYEEEFEGWEPWSNGFGRRIVSEGRWFESRRRTLDGHNIFSHIFVVKIVMFV